MALKKAKPQYWAMHWFGTYQRCSHHKTAQAALRTAERCEAGGGSHHDIVEVQVLNRARIKRST